MKKQLTLALVLATTLTFTACGKAAPPAATPPTQEAAATTFTDPRDKKTYKTVKIGEQVWMAENLNYEAKGSKCYDNKPANCQKYGRLYDWNTAMKACPSGWKLPSQQEWESLADAIGGNISSDDCADCYEVSKLKSKNGWNESNGTDDYGFSALPGGISYPGYGADCGNFCEVGELGYWWTATTANSEDIAYIWVMSDYTDIWNGSYKTKGLSVRCIKD